MSLTTKRADDESDLRAVPSDAGASNAEPRPGDVRIIIPVFEEAETLAEVAAEVERAFALLPALAYEVVFVDDGSRDASWAVMRVDVRKGWAPSLPYREVTALLRTRV